MVAIPAYGEHVGAHAASDFNPYKLALSLHDMLDTRQIPSSHRAPSDRLSSQSSSSDGFMDDVGVKKSFQPYHSRSVPKSENLEAHYGKRVSSVPITTMMLRNIPNKYTQNSLLKEVDDLGFAGTYDFFYLPMDVHNRSNVGYAFINFLTAHDAKHFRMSFSDHRFQRFHSRKIGSVCVAHVQGLDANLRHFENRAVTQARNDQYRPIVLCGQQRMDFERAVALAKARAPRQNMPDKVPKVCANTPAMTDPRQELELAIRGLLASPDLAPQRSCPGEPQAVGQQGEDVAHLISLRNLLLSQLHVQKDSPAYIHPCSFQTAGADVMGLDL